MFTFIYIETVKKDTDNCDDFSQSLKNIRKI